MDHINVTESPLEDISIKSVHTLVHKFFDAEVFTVRFADLIENGSGDYTEPTPTPVYCYVRYKPSLHVTGIVITALIWLANLLVLFLFARNRALRRAASNYLLFSLSLIDLLSGASLTVFLLPYFYLHAAGCKRLTETFGMSYYIAADQLVNFLFLASIGHLVALSTERVISLFWALNYEKIVRKYRVWIVCGTIWGMSLLLSSIQLSWQNFNSVHSSEDAQRVAKYDKIFSLIAFVVFAVIPAIVLVVQYSCMFFLIKRLIKTCPGASQTRRSLKERKALIIYCAMFVSYIFLVFPYFTLRIVIDHVARHEWEQIPPEVPESALMLRFMVSVINPLLYTLYKNDFRKALVRLYRASLLPLCWKTGSPRRVTEIQRLDDGMLAGETEMSLIQRRQSDPNGGKDVGKLLRRIGSTQSGSSRRAKRQALTNGTSSHEKLKATIGLPDAVVVSGIADVARISF